MIILVFDMHAPKQHDASTKNIKHRIRIKLFSKQGKQQFLVSSVANVPNNSGNRTGNLIQDSFIDMRAFTSIKTFGEGSIQSK